MNSNDKQIAFMNLFEPVRANLSRFCFSISLDRDDAKDLISETIVQAFENFEMLKKTDAFKSYLFSIASRINKRKNWRKRLFVRLDKEHLDIQISKNNSENELDVEILNKLMNKLPQKQKEAIALFDISGFSLEEIREIQGGSLSGVKSRLKRGREKLAEMLTDNYSERNNQSKEVGKVYSINKYVQGELK